MKKCKIVIGKNFGDEGKGKLTDFWAQELTRSGESGLVIKNNGGAQAGHTVEEKGFRFVFHQLGSGSYRGFNTLLGSSFFPDLLKLPEEIKEFEAASGRKAPRIYACEDCVCTLPFDVLLNNLLESGRGRQKHGSCGMGIYEARRRKEAGYGCMLGELAEKNPAEIERCLFRIREEYVAERLKEIPADIPQSEEWLSLLWDDNIIRNSAQIFYDTIQNDICIQKVNRDSMREFLKAFDVLLFENAQGLLLDEDNLDYFPHLTPSHTGLVNVRTFWEKYGLGDFIGQTQVGYVTRSYVTRHGMGRLDYECNKADINEKMQDLTNVSNPWQDGLRYAYHPDGNAFFQAMEKDLAQWPTERRQGLSPKLYVTHLDETEDKVWFANGALPFEAFRERYGRNGIGIERLD